MQKENCNTNIGDTIKPDFRQETQVAKETCTNMDEDLKIANSGNGSSNNTRYKHINQLFPDIPITWR